MSLPKPTQPAIRRLSPLRDLWPFLRPYRGRVALAFTLLCLGSTTMLLVPLAFRDLIDFGFGQRATTGSGLFGTSGLNSHFLLLFGLASLWAVTVAARFYTVSWVGERVTADLRSAVYARMLVQSPQFFETLQTGEVLSRLTGDTTLIQTVVGSSISMGLRSLFQFIGGMVMLAVTSFYLFSLNLGLMALLMLPIFAIGRRVKKLSRESQDRIADASALAGEILNAIPTVQAYTQERQETARFTGRAEASFATAIRRTRVRSMMTVVVITAVMGTIIFVLWVGANQVQAGSMTGGQLASFILYAALVAGGVGTMAEGWGDVMRAAGATERLLELLHAQSAIAEAAAPQLQPHQWAGHPRAFPARPARPDRHRAAGSGDLLGQCAGEHPLRPSRRERRGSHRRRQGGAGGRIHRPPAGRLPDLPRRARHAPVRWAAPAHRHRARDPEGRAVAAARRSHQRAGCGIGDPRAAGAERRHAGTHHPHHRPPPGHRAEGAAHRRAGGRAHRRDRHSGRLAQTGRTLRAAGEPAVRRLTRQAMPERRRIQGQEAMPGLADRAVGTGEKQFEHGTY